MSQDPYDDSHSLPVYAVLRGFRKQVDLLETCEGVPQSVLSSMYRGNRAYPRARAIVSESLWPTLGDDERERRILSLIDNSKE